MRGKTERWLPLVAGSFAAVSYLCFFRNYTLPFGSINLFFVSLVCSNITSILLFMGLLAVNSMNEKYVIRQLQITGLYDRLLNYFLDAIIWSMITSLISTVNFNIAFQDNIIAFSKQNIWYAGLFVFWLFVLTVTAFSFCRVLNIFAGILVSTD